MTCRTRRSYDAPVTGRRVLGAEPWLRVSLPATRISSSLLPVLVAPGLRGEVVACHRHAINIEAAGRLVTVASDAAGGLPDGINVGSVFAPRDAGLAPGMAVIVEGGSLVIGGIVGLDLRGATPWSPTLHPISVAAPGLAARAAAAALAARPLRGGFTRGPVASEWSFPSRAWTAVENLTAALRDGAGATEITDAGRSLIGLGPGLTPSGDDLLVGLLATLHALGDPRAGDIGASWARAAATGTTAVAASFHRHAAGGAFAERLHDLLVAVLAGPVPGITAAVGLAAAWGATSGADTVLGVTVALGARATDRAAGRIAA